MISGAKVKAGYSDSEKFVENGPTMCCGTWFGWREVWVEDGAVCGLLHSPDGFVLPFRHEKPDLPGIDLGWVLG